MQSEQEIKEIPHLIIKKVARSSQKHMEEFAKQFGTVESVYYSKSENDHPFMFVVYQKESSVYKAYVRINEQFPMYQASLKPLLPPIPMYCTECMKGSYYFCESCSAPYCSETCQKKNWTEHAVKCVSIPKLVQMQWRDNDQNQPVAVNITDRVVIVGYQTTGSVTVRVLGDDKDQQFLSFLDDCNAEADRSPVAITVMKDTKVWALHREQWYRAKVEAVTGQKVTVLLLDLAMTKEMPKDKLRLLQCKSLFFHPSYTRAFRLKSLRQKDVFSSTAVRNYMEQAILKKDKFTVTDTANNYIDLQIDGTPKSFNHSLVLLYERQTGIIEEAPTPPPEVKTLSTTTSDRLVTVPIFYIASVTYPKYEPEIQSPLLYVFSTVYDGMTWVLNAFYMKHANELRNLSQQLKGAGKALFKGTPHPKSFDDIELNQLCLLRNDGDDYDRCVYQADETFESIDVGLSYKNVTLDRVRHLPRELISASYLMVLLLDEDFVEDMKAMTNKLTGLKNCPVDQVDQLVHLGENKFKCIWRKV